MNIKCLLAYDGTNYLGWQKTKEGPSIEEELQKVLKQILQEEILLQAASRTDRGVHATGQIINFCTMKEHLDLEKFHKSLNSLLPKDISIISVEQAEDHFHPTLDAVAKEYHYEVCTNPVLIPQKRYYIWHYPYTLSLVEMNEAKREFLGKKEFQSFCNVRMKSSLREIYQIYIEEKEPGYFLFSLLGNSFLYKMVRTIVGTLVYIGKGKIAKDYLPHIFLSKDRTLAGMTAPAHGLTLARVFYEWDLSSFQQLNIFPLADRLECF